MLFVQFVASVLSFVFALQLGLRLQQTDFVDLNLGKVMDIHYLVSLQGGNRVVVSYNQAWYRPVLVRSDNKCFPTTGLQDGVMQ